MSEYQRRRRSKETVTAITYQLEYVMDNYDVDLILLADEQGLVIAFAGDQTAANALGAFARQLTEGAEPDPTLKELIPGLAPERILCEVITLDDIPLYLCAVMTPNKESAYGFERARTGIKRIYKTTGSHH